jgi:hypothetical protein
MEQDARSKEAHLAAQEPALTIQTINPNLINAQYAVRGALAIRAEELKIVKLPEG